MNCSKKRVLDAIKHNKYDKVPIDFWSSSETDDKLIRHLGLNNRTELLNHLDVDIVYIEGPKYIGPPLKEYSDGSSDDIWGVRRKVCFAGKGDKKQSYKSKRLWTSKGLVRT